MATPLKTHKVDRLGNSFCNADAQEGSYRWDHVTCANCLKARRN